MIALLVIALGTGGSPSPPPAWIEVTPTTLRVEGGVEEAAEHPIVAALDRAGPGTHVRLERGEYAPFTLGFRSSAKHNATPKGGKPGQPIVIDGGGFARITTRGGDTIAIDQAAPFGHVTFRDLEIEPGDRSAVMFYRQSGGAKHQSFHFENVRIIGQWDPLTGRGKKSKWGVWGHSLADFRFTGSGGRAVIKNVRFEHGFYLQNPRGNITIEGVEAWLLGRTFLQVTARAKEGPPGRGKLTVRDCKVNDVGISDADGFKGGAAFTLAGRFEGTALFERNTYRAGFQPKLARKLKLPGEPYGTGAFVAWDGGEAPNAELVLRDNLFEFAEGCGDRPVVEIGGCKSVRLLGTNRFRSGGEHAALALDPRRDDGTRISVPNGSVYVAPLTELQGGVTIDGKVAGKEEMRALMRPR